MNFLVLLLSFTFIAKIESGGDGHDSGISYTSSVISSEIKSESSSPSASVSIISSSRIEQSSSPSLLSAKEITDLIVGFVSSIENAYKNYVQQIKEIQNEIYGNETVVKGIAEELTNLSKNDETLKPLADELDKILAQLSTTPPPSPIDGGIKQRRKRSFLTEDECGILQERLSDIKYIEKLVTVDLKNAGLKKSETLEQIQTMSKILENNKSKYPPEVTAKIETMIKSLNAVLAAKTQEGELANDILKNGKEIRDSLDGQIMEACFSGSKGDVIPPK